MLSQDAKNLTNSIRDLQHKAEQMAHVLDCIKINLQSLADSLTVLERNTIVSQPSERPSYEDYQNIA